MPTLPDFSCICRCHFSLPSVEAEDDTSKGRMPPVKVKFEIPYFTVSGIQVGERVKVFSAVWAVRMPPIKVEFVGMH